MSWRERVTHYPIGSLPSIRTLDDAALSDLMARAEQGEEFGDTVVISLLHLLARQRIAAIDEFYQRALRWRDVVDPCPSCAGVGSRAYPSTATWRGGIGGCMITSDVCDTCWGSGDELRRWADLRKLRAEEESRVARRAAELIAVTVGAPLASCAVAIDYISAQLDKIADKRGAPVAPHLDAIARSLSNILRRAIGKPERT